MKAREAHIQRPDAASQGDDFGLYRAAAGIFLLCALALAWPFLSGEYTIPWDAKAHFQPQFAFLAHALHRGELALLDAQCLRRHAADRRSAVADLLSLLSRRGRARAGALLLARGRARPRDARDGRPRANGLFPRSRLACRRRAACGAGFRLRRLGELAHPAHGPDHEPRLAAGDALAPGARARPALGASGAQRRESPRPFWCWGAIRSAICPC